MEHPYQYFHVIFYFIAHVLQPCCMSGSPYSISFVEVDTECLEKRSRSVEETSVLVVVEASHS